MLRLNTPIEKTTHTQRWMLLAIGILVFIILFHGFTIAVNNVREQYGFEQTNPITKTED